MASAAEQLLDLLEPRFSFITVANGYTESLKSIKRETMGPYQSQDIPRLRYWSEGSQLEEHRYKYQIWLMQIVINAQTTARDQKFSNVASRLADEIMTACQRLAGAPTPADRWNSNLYNGANERVGEILFTQAVYAVGEGAEPYCSTAIGAFIRYNVAPGAPSVLLPM